MYLRAIQTVKEKHVKYNLKEVVVKEPHLDCDILVRVGDVGVHHGGEGVVAVALVALLELSLEQLALD